MQYFPPQKIYIFEKIIVLNFKIFENNIISVKIAKAVGYTCTHQMVIGTDLSCALMLTFASCYP